MKHSIDSRLYVVLVLTAAVLGWVGSAAGQANVQGQWTTLPSVMPINPIHAALLPNGKLLLIAGSGNCPPSQSGCPAGAPYGASNSSGAGLFDPTSGTFTQFTLSWDMFCNGMVLLPDGRVLVDGGTIQYDPFFGEQRASIFDPNTNLFTDIQSMAHGRWYPTVTTLPNGEVMTFSGLDENSNTNPAVEIFDVNSGWSQQYIADWTPPLYPRLHVLPNGQVFYSGSGTNSALFNPATDDWTLNIATTNYDGTRTYGTSVLLPLSPTNNYDPRIMIMGGNNPATNTTEIIDMGATTPAWVWGPNMTEPRIEMNAVILPSGNVLALGGSLNDEDTTTLSLNADLYNPSTNAFSSAGANASERLYHSVALLLPDATVWLAGGNPERGTYNNTMEIYQPAYLFNSSGQLATRPSITSAPSFVSYGSQFTVQTPDAATISSVVLERFGAVTHAFNTDQRLLGTSFTIGSGSLTVTAPPNGNVAPPGYYMLFLLNSAGVPSVAAIMELAQQPDFSIAITPSSQTVLPGGSTSYSVNMVPSGYTGAVSFTVGGLPSGATAQFNPTSLTGDGTSVMSVYTLASTPTGSYPLTVTATGGTLVHKESVTLQVTLPAAATPTFSPGPGTYGTAQSVGLSDTTPGATIYYTTNGTTPTTSSAVYSAPIAVTTSMVIQAIAAASGYDNSAVASGTYVISGGNPSVNFSAGFTGVGMAFNGSASLNGTALELTDGGSLEAGSGFYIAPLNVQSFTTNFSFQLTNPNADGMAFVIQNVGTTALGPDGGGLGYGPSTPGGTPGIGNSIAVKFDLYDNDGEGDNSTGLYTDGASPTVPATTLGGGVNLHSGDPFNVQLTYNGTTLSMTITDASVPADTFTTSWAINIPSTVGGNTAYAGFTGGTGGLTATQQVLTWSYTSAAAAATPTFSPAPGTYGTAQAVSLADTTTGATIYYTTNGTTPTTSSTVYSAPIAVNSSETIEAMAAASGYSNSAVASGAYVINLPPAATPTFSPVPGTYATGQSVAISDTTPLDAGLVIYYTTNGTTPTTSSPVYSKPIAVNSSETIEAMATASGYSNSAVASGAYVIGLPAAATPTFSPVPGTYGTGQSVTISDTTTGATIYYTTNGTTPTTSSPVYSTPITVNSSETIEAMAAASGYNNSAVASGAYVISGGNPSVNFSTGFASAGMAFNGSASLKGTALQLTDGGSLEAGSGFYTTPLNVQSFTTNFSIQLTDPNADGMAFVIQNTGTTALGPDGGGLGYGPGTPGGTPGIGNSIAVKFDLYNNDGEGDNSTGLYTDGASPTVPATTLGGGVNLHSGDVFNVQMTYNGTTLSMTITDADVPADTFTTSWTINIPSTVGGNTAYAGFTGGTGGMTATQQVLTWSYTSAPAAATPTFSPAPGTYGTAQSVALADTTSGATIYYTTNGTTPTTSSPVYSKPIAVNSSETIEAMAAASGYSNSAVASGAYVINLPAAAAPTFSPAPGTYGTAQSVALADTTTGATIYYTTNGTTPTTSSPVYSTPIAVNNSETIEAMATANGYSNSAVASGAYVINLPQAATPTFNPVPGTYGTGQSVTISDTTTGATIYYTTNGTTPTTSSPVYSTPITVNSSETIEAMAAASGYNNSAVASGAYVISGGNPSVNFSTGFASAGMAFNGSASLKGTALQLTDGGSLEAGSGFYTTPLNVQSFTTNFSIQLTDPNADGMAFVIQNTGTTALGPDGGGLGYGPGTPGGTPGIGNSIAVKFDLYNNDGEGDNSTGLYTDGASPTVPATTLGGGVNLHSGDVFNVQMTYNGTTLSMTITDADVPADTFTTSWTINIPSTVGGNTAYAGFTGGTGGMTATQQVLTWSYTSAPAAATPTFSPAPGTYGTAQSVALADTTSGATIYYTTNGTTPTTSSPVYSKPIAVNSSETIEAMAAASGYSNSAVASGAYVINLPAAAAPTFSPAPGTYGTAQSVALADTTTGATIYYTTNGTTPTTSSPVYSTPIAVNSSETIEAMAAASGYNNSAVASGAYVISGGNPSVNFSTGFASAGMAFNGSASLKGTALQLTDGGSLEAGSGFYTTPLNVQSFTTNFSIQLTNPNADGMAFVIQNTGTTALGLDGGGLGYGPDEPGDPPGIGNSIAVKFDLYDNDGEGDNSTGLYTDGASPTVPATTLGGGVNLHSGDPFNVQMTYNGTTLSMTITDASVPADTFTTSWTINIPSTVGGNTAYAGFTGGTGGLTATQQVLTWTYTSGQ